MSGLGCCPVGVLVVEVPADAELVRLSWAMLANASRPGSTYAMVRLTGGTTERVVEVRLPGVGTEADSYAIEVENRSSGGVLVSSDASGESFELDPRLEAEASLEEEVQDGAESVWTYRTSVRVGAAGARRAPGFTG